MAQDESYEWKPEPAALTAECYTASDPAGREVMLFSHPTTPFRRQINGDVSLNEAKLQEVAQDYLTRLSSYLNARKKDFEERLSPECLSRLDEVINESALDWMPLSASLNGSETPPAALPSRLMRRKGADGKEHQTFVLIKSDKLNAPVSAPPHSLPVNVEFGLRVVVHHVHGPDGEFLHITSLTVYPYADGVVSSDSFSGLPREDKLIALGSAFDSGIIADLEAIARLVPPRALEVMPPEPLVPEKIRLFENGRADYTGFGLDTTLPARGLPLPFEYTISVSTAGGDLSPRLSSKRPLVASATKVTVFEQDPPSWTDDAGVPRSVIERRPTREEKKLKSFLVETEIATGSPADFPLETEDFVVRLCRDHVREDGADRMMPLDPPPPDASTDNTPKRVNLLEDGDKVRRDNNSAIAAYYNVKQAFDLLHEFGIDLDQFFSSTETTPKKLHVFYRSGTSRGRGRDGRTINGEVWLRPTTSKNRIEMHLALGALRHRTLRKKDDAHAHHKNLIWGEYLGIANSERWVWHELGHVLIAGSTGDLEFTFAHSAGDALAAIWADPRSALADPRAGTSTDFAPDGMRGYTFPWVHSTRRHDRCVLNGWSWGGTFQYPVTNSTVGAQVTYKGYLSEQILSTTLFRLYLILGGDTLSVATDEPDYLTRHVASRVTMYLIIRGIESLTAMHERAEEFEASMIEADLGLLAPLRVSLADFNPPGADFHDWVGGMAHKAIRWAFEAQGMHSARPGEIVDAPGEPPLVDIYVPDFRQLEETADAGAVKHSPGSYVPVSLDWRTPDESEGSWMAKPDGLDGLKAGDFPNRGKDAATSIATRCWLGLVTGDRSSAGWDREPNIQWLMLDGAASVPLDEIDGHIVEATATHGGGSSPPVLIHVLEISCPEDRANTDPAALLRCAVPADGFPASVPPHQAPSTGAAHARPRDLTDLVANDNNLGLYWTPLTSS